MITIVAGPLPSPDQWLILGSSKLATVVQQYICFCLFTIMNCRYAASIDDILEEEEHYADQIKEYLSYAEALR